MTSWNNLQLTMRLGKTPRVLATTTPRIMTGVTIAMVGVGLALTVFAGPLYDLSERAGQNLEGDFYQDAVFPEGLDE